MNKLSDNDCVLLMLICGSLWCLVLCSCMSTLDVNNVCSGGVGICCCLNT